MQRSCSYTLRMTPTDAAAAKTVIICLYLIFKVKNTSFVLSRHILLSVRLYIIIPGISFNNKEQPDKLLSLGRNTYYFTKKNAKSQYQREKEG